MSQFQLWIFVNFVFFIFSAVLASKINLWNANFGLEIKEVCDHDDLDILIIEGLQLIPTTFKSSKKTSIAHVLKMSGMGPNHSAPFPHYYRFFKEKTRGAVYADFLNVKGLGEALKSCLRRKVKIVLQVKIESDSNTLTRRKRILLSSLLWNSFIGDGKYFDRPFGQEISFDGFHFVHDKATVSVVTQLVKRLSEMAWNSEKEIILSTGSSDFKYNSGRMVSESAFVITNDPKSVDGKIPFAVVLTGNEKNLDDSFKRSKSFYGIVRVLSKKNRFEALKKLLSRNPSSSNSSSIGLIIVLGSVSVSLILLSYAGYYLWKLKRTPEVLKA